MPVAFKNGKIFPKILICFQEKTGKLGPIVKKKIIHIDNIVLTASRSGKLSTFHVQWWQVSNY